MSHPDPNLIALGVRQPWVELILRGLKTIEVRSRNTDRRGTIYLYASKKHSTQPAARVAAEKHVIEMEQLPTGLLVGTVEITDVAPCTREDHSAACLSPGEMQNRFSWKLQNPRRLAAPIPVRFLPYGVWFYPFRRKNRVG